MKKYIIIAAFAALGFTACEEKSVDAKKDDAKKSVDKAADKAKEEKPKPWTKPPMPLAKSVARAPLTP